jgi:hypothetical protein
MVVVKIEKLAAVLGDELGELSLSVPQIRVL